MYQDEQEAGARRRESRALEPRVWKEIDRPMEPLGPKLRRQRRRLGFTLDELAGRTGISKPYLSLIETGRVANPPSDEKLRRLEQPLGFHAGELVSQAHRQRTRRDVRAMFQKLMHITGTEGRRHEGTKNGENSTSCLTASVP